MKNSPLILLVALLTLAAGCGKSDTVRTADGSQVTMKGKGDQATMEIKSKNGEKTILSVGDKVELPADFPKDVPIYPKGVVKMNNKVGPMLMVGIYFPASIEDGQKFYQDELKAQGWAITVNTKMGDGYMITASKGSRDCTVMITKPDKESYAQLTISTK